MGQSVIRQSISHSVCLTDISIPTTDDSDHPVKTTRLGLVVVSPSLGTALGLLSQHGPPYQRHKDHCIAPCTAECPARTPLTRTLVQGLSPRCGHEIRTESPLCLSVCRVSAFGRICHSQCHLTRSEAARGLSTYQSPAPIWVTGTCSVTVTHFPDVGLLVRKVGPELGGVWVGYSCCSLPLARPECRSQGRG